MLLKLTVAVADVAVFVAVVVPEVPVVFSFLVEVVAIVTVLSLGDS